MTSFKEASERLEGRSKNGTSSRAEQQKFLINMPCKYHKKGLCKLGKSCRFLHANQKTKKTPTVNLPTTAEKTVCVQISKFGRRPFLQLVVLYASDARVSKYADEILEILLVAGIDVVVQNSVQQGSVPPAAGTKVPKAKDIKAEHLAELICTSHADFLIVVGDKNMKNRSCQAKRKGKLLEMMVEDVISLIWKSWPQNPHKTLARIKSLTIEQTTSLLFQYCGPKHISDRFEYLSTLKKEILSTYKIGSWCDSLEDKLSNLQKCAMTLHKQLKKAMKVLSELAVQVENPELSRGSVKTFEYKPSACRTPKSTIAYPLQIHLYCFIVDMMKSIEVRFPTALWNEYYSEHVGTWMVNYAELERIRDEMWKALEEHEKSLLNQEGEGSKSEDEEDGEDEGMFSDLKDEDIENSLLGELEPRVMPESGAEDTAQIASEQSTSSSQQSEEGSVPSAPVKFPFSFPMPTTAIFTPPPSTSTDSEKDTSPPIERAKDKGRDIEREKASTPPVGLGRGMGLGRSSSKTNIDATYESGRTVGLGRGMSLRGETQRTEPNMLSAGRRGSTGGLELPGEFGIGQRRDWSSRGPSGALSARENTLTRRVSDLGTTRSHLATMNELSSATAASRTFEPKAEDLTRQRAATKEEKLLALQLDRQLERRLELERQLEREKELERQLERQLEKRKQKTDYSGRSSISESDIGLRMPLSPPGRRESRDLRDVSPNTYNPFALSGSPAAPPIQPQRRSSFVVPPASVTPPPPGLSPPPPSRMVQYPTHDEEYRPASRRESVSSSHFNPFGSDASIPASRSSFSQSQPTQPHYSPFSERMGSLAPREIGSGMPESETRPSRSSSSASPRPSTPGFASEMVTGGNIRDLTLFPTNMYGSVQRADPFYQEISKIWGGGTRPSRMSFSSDRLFEDSSSDIDETQDRPVSPGSPGSASPHASHKEEHDEGSDEFKEGDDSSHTTTPPRRMLPPKLTLQHGFVLKPDPVAST